MKQRYLGSGKLAVSAMGMGCWGMSHAYGPADEKEAIAAIEAAMDRGVNFFDTADVYGDGHNEALLGRAVKARRKQVVIATKFGFVGDENGHVGIDGRPEHVIRACEKSLRRLGTDVIDLYYLHRRDPQVPIEETLGAMADLVKAGKIRHIGLSEVSVRTLERAHAVHPVTALQSEYSLWCRDVEKEMLPACRRLGISLVPFSPLGRGFLTGAIKDPGELDEKDYRRALPRFSNDNFQVNLSMIKEMVSMAETLGVTASQLALAWILSRSDDMVPIPGMKRIEHVTENLAALDLNPGKAALEKLSALSLRVAGARHNAYNLKFMENEGA